MFSETCGPLAGVEIGSAFSTTTTHQYDNSLLYDAHQPLIDRRSSDNVAMLKDFKWDATSTRRSETPLVCDAGRQGLIFLLNLLTCLYYFVMCDKFYSFNTRKN